jgi:capsular polysaccharide biosynthesis protein
MTPRTLTVPDLARFGTARAGAVIIVSLVVLGVIAGVIWNVVQGPRWTATTNVLIRLSSVDTLLLTGNVDSSNSTDQMDDAFLSTSQDILGEVIRQLHPVGGLLQLQKDVNATPQGSSHVIVISATEPDPVTAQRISDTVANTFVAAVRTRLTTLAASLQPTAVPAVPVTAAIASPALTSADADVLARARLIASTVQPLQVFHDQLPSQQPPARVPAALGIVGLAAGALVVLALSLLGLRVDRPRDAQRLLEVPAVPYDRSDGSAAAARLVQAVLRAHPVGTLLICPVDPEAELAAVRFAGWVREHGQGEQDSPREVRLVPEPASAVVGARPPAQDTAGLLLVVPRGTSRHVLADAAALLNTWRRVDAVAVTT